MASRWRIFCRPIISEPDRVILYTKAAIALHNYLRVTESSVYCPPGCVDAEDGVGNVVDGSWRTEIDSGALNPLGRIGGNRYSQCASSVQDAFRDYFCTSVGEVSWQYDFIRRVN